MAVNRYDRPYGQQYVSQYIPLPFEQLAAVGQNMNVQRQAAEAKMSQLEKMIADVKVADEVYSQGDSNNPNYGYRSTGYRDFQNQLLSKASQAHADLTNQYMTGKIDLAELNRQANQFANDFKQDYSKLKVAEANSINIMKLNEELNKSNDAATHTFLTNKLAREGSRLLQNPFSTEYKGAPIGKYIEEEDMVNKFASDFKDKILKDTGSYKDKYGKIHYRSMTGVGEKDILASLGMVDDSGIGQQWQEKAYYELVSRGINPNAEKIVEIPKYDKNGKQTGVEKIKTTEFNYLYNDYKQDFVNAVIAKARHENPDEKILNDDFGDWLKKRAVEEQDALNIKAGSEVGEPEVSSVNSIIKGLGLEGILDDKGNYIVDGKIVPANIMGMPFAIYNPSGGQSADDVVNRGFDAIVKIAKKLGIQPKDPNGNPTGDYRGALFNYIQNISKQRSTTSNVLPEVSDDMTKYHLSENSDIHNMEIYKQGNEDSNTKETSETIDKMAGNSKVTGIDYYGSNLQAGWKLSVTPKDDKGNTTGVDQAYIAIPRNKDFEMQSRPVWIVSRGAIEFSKTGEVNPKFVKSKYNDVLQEKIYQDFATLLETSPDNLIDDPQYKIVASSDEDRGGGEKVIRATVVQNYNNTPRYITYEYNTKTGKGGLKSIDEVQEDQTVFMTHKGALKKYTTKLKNRQDISK